MADEGVEWKRPPGYQPGDANEVKWATLPTPLVSSSMRLACELLDVNTILPQESTVA